MLASKHGGCFLNEIFVYSEDITQTPVSSKHWKFRKMTTKDFGPKMFEKWFSRDLKIINSGFVDRQ